MIYNVITKELMSDIINNKYKYLITRDMIIENLNDRVESLNSDFIFFTTFILVMIIFIITYILIKKKSSRIRIVVGAIIFTLILGINTYKYINIRNNIIYSLENNSWSIETDRVINMYVGNFLTNTVGCYYIELDKYGKTMVPASTYINIDENNDVYVIYVKGKNGKKNLITNQIWSCKDTIFIESLKLDAEKINMLK